MLCSLVLVLSRAALTVARSGREKHIRSFAVFSADVCRGSARRRIYQKMAENDGAAGGGDDRCGTATYLSACRERPQEGLLASFVNPGVGRESKRESGREEGDVLGVSERLADVRRSLRPWVRLRARFGKHAHHGRLPPVRFGPLQNGLFDKCRRVEHFRIRPATWDGNRIFWLPEGSSHRSLGQLPGRMIGLTGQPHKSLTR
eukprot:170915-Pyramimonas_sp.AAC.1